MPHPFRGLVVATVMGMMALSACAASKVYVGSTQNFSVAKTTEIPGGTLEAGDYTIQVLDQLSDRMLVRVDNTHGKQHSLFLAVPHAAFANAVGGGPSDWRAGAEGDPALRGFAFSNGSTIEFVYPKGEAAAIATKNAEKVIAIDPESEGKPKLQKMSQDDMKIVTLWMLSLTTASPNSKTPALLAQRYRPDAETDGTTLAQNDALPAPSTEVPARSQSQRSHTLPTSDSAHNTSLATAATRHPALKELPHTASGLPLIWLTGMLSLLLALATRFGRLWVR